MQLNCCVSVSDGVGPRYPNSMHLVTECLHAIGLITHELLIMNLRSVTERFWLNMFLYIKFKKPRKLLRAEYISLV